MIRGSKSILNIIPSDCRFHLLFEASLHRGVQRQNHAVPLPGGHVIFVGEGHIHLIIALGGDDLALFRLQKAVVGRLHTLRAGIGGVGKANHLAGKASEGVITLGGRFQMDTGDLIVVLLLLLMSVDDKEDKNMLLLTLALYFLL